MLFAPHQPVHYKHSPSLTPLPKKRAQDQSFIQAAMIDTRTCHFRQTLRNMDHCSHERGLQPALTRESLTSPNCLNVSQHTQTHTHTHTHTHAPIWTTEGFGICIITIKYNLLIIKYVRLRSAYEKPACTNSWPPMVHGLTALKGLQSPRALRNGCEHVDSKKT